MTDAPQKPILTPPPPPVMQPEEKGNRGVGLIILFSFLAIALIAVIFVLPRLLRGPVTVTEADQGRGDSGAVPVISEKMETPVSVPTPPKPESQPSAVTVEPEPEPAVRVKTKAAPVVAGVIVEKAEAPQIDPREQAFAEAIGRGLDALESGQFKQAESAFLVADKAIPGRSSVADGLKQARFGIRANQLESLRKQGAEQESQEAWDQAEATYKQALALDADVGFAQAGLERAVDAVRIHSELDFHLKNPHRLTTAAVAKEAESLARRAAQVTHSPNAAKKGQQLTEQIAQWNQPVSVSLNSDGKTHIRITGVGMLDPFQTKSLDLKPGSYTVTGARNGFRDVRLKLEIKPGQSDKALEVVCKERI